MKKANSSATIPTSSMADLYAKYDQHFQSLNPMDAADYAHAVRYYERLYGRFLPTDPKSRIMDVGCGGGHFLFFLKAKGFLNHLGVEQDGKLAEFVKAWVTPEVVNEDMFAFIEVQPAETVSVVALNDVIEHVDKNSGLRLLKLAHRILTPGGLLLMKTINMSHPLALRSRYMDLTHEQGYTEESLRQLLVLAAFRPVHIGPAEPSWANRIIRYGLYPLYRLNGHIVPRVVTTNMIAVAMK